MTIPACQWLKCKAPCTFILLALVFHFFVALSLPFIRPLYIVATTFNSSSTKLDITIEGSQKLTEIRVSLAKL